MIKSFEIMRNEKNIRGFIHVPKGDILFPCVIFSHGFSSNSTESHFMFTKIANMLMDIGIASIRFDYLGSGNSDGSFKDVTVSEELMDLKTVYDYVYKENYIDNLNINLLGMSFGGTISLLYSARNPGIVQNTILICPAINAVDILVKDLKNDILTTCLEKNIIDFSGNVLSSRAIEDALSYNFLIEASKLKEKALIIHGTNDSVVPPYYSYKLKQTIGEKAQLVWIKGSDHIFSSMIFENQLLYAIKQFSLSNIIK